MRASFPLRSRLKPDPKFGGIAGGKKFQKGNQLFKFAEDVEVPEGSGHWVYGGNQRDDRAAMKSAGHEIKATQALIDAGMTQLNYPLMAAFTYRGKRVLCVSLLPVKGKLTLQQGKDNVKDSIRVSPEHVEAVMATMGANLRIAKSRKAGEEIYGPFDMEIHQGEDGLLYVIDAARLMPPEYRGGVDPGPKQYYQLLRPELLRKVGKPVVPDALKKEYGDAKARADLKELSSLLDVEIKLLAEELELGQHVDCLERRVNLKALVHARGLNMRHLAEVVAAMDVGCSARSQLEALLKMERPINELDVKTVTHPRALTAVEVRAVLELQDAALKYGEQRLQMIPTLLQLSRLVPLEQNGGRFPSTHHPLGHAFEICRKFDPLIKVEQEDWFFGPNVSACSAVTLPVLFEMARDSACWQAWDNLERVSDSHKSELPHPQIDRCLARHKYGLGVESVIQVAMQHAAAQGEWGQVWSWTTQYDCIVEALVVAAEHGNIEFVRSHFVDRAAQATLESASRHGRLEVVSFLVEDCAVREFGESVSMAARTGHDQVVQFLLQSGADVGVLDTQGRTALHWVAISGCTECVKVLFAAGLRYCFCSPRGRADKFVFQFFEFYDSHIHTNPQTRTHKRKPKHKHKHKQAHPHTRSTTHKNKLTK
jgi:hypothetical protein